MLCLLNGSRSLCSCQQTGNPQILHRDDGCSWQVVGEELVDVSILRRLGRHPHKHMS